MSFFSRLLGIAREDESDVSALWRRIVAVASVRLQSAPWYALPLILGFFAWASLARIVRAEFMSLREKEFVEAARAVGGAAGVFGFFFLVVRLFGNEMTGDNLRGSLVLAAGGGIVALVGSLAGWKTFGQRNAA